MLKLTKEDVELGFNNGFDVEARGKSSGSRWQKIDNPKWNWNDIDYRLSNTCMTGETIDGIMSAKENGRIIFVGGDIINNIDSMISIIIQEPEWMNQTFVLDRLRIAVDFDGTITNTGLISGNIDKIKNDMLYNNGIPQEYCNEVINKWYYGGVTVIINTCRIGVWADAAKAFLHNNGINYNIFNDSTIEDQENFGRSEKVSADIYIDDRNLGGLPAWKDIERLVAKHAFEYIAKPLKKIILCLKLEESILQ